MPQSLKYVFLLGRPGCGKSTIFRALVSKLTEEKIATSVDRLDDFPILWAKFKADAERAKEGKPRVHSERHEDGEYGVTIECLDECLLELSAQVEESWHEGKLVFIEFARSSYVHALSCFSDEVLSAAVIVYIECDFDTCWERNVRRSAVAREEGTDDHLTPRYIMEELYLHDDQNVLEKQYGDRVVIINNEVEGAEHLDQQVSSVLEHVRTRFTEVEGS